MASFCAVPSTRLIYAGPPTKEDFDRIALPEKVHGWVHDNYETAKRGDGLQYEQRCHSKALGEIDTVIVIFQWFEWRVAAEAQS